MFYSRMTIFQNKLHGIGNVLNPYPPPNNSSSRGVFDLCFAHFLFIDLLLECYYDIETIYLAQNVSFSSATFATFMDEHPLLFFELDIDWLHHPTTILEAISRIDVDMLGPETLGAMIGIAGADHLGATLLTNK
jgi:hypothetical protein